VKTISGKKFISMAALADRLGVSKRTLQRWEKDGRLSRPEFQERVEGKLGGGNDRWYSPAEVQAAIALLSRQKEQQQEAKEKAQLRTPLQQPWLTREDRTVQPPRRWGRIQGGEQQEPEPEVLQVEVCPHCGGRDTIVHTLEAIQGAHPVFGEVVRCEKCGTEVGDEQELPAEPERWGTAGDGGYTAAFFPATSTASTRRRPEPLTHVAGAVRPSGPVKQPRFERPLDPLG
jgi:transcriptional regulator with XRE-family HTH domain